MQLWSSWSLQICGNLPRFWCLASACSLAAAPGVQQPGTGLAQKVNSAICPLCLPQGGNGRACVCRALQPGVNCSAPPCRLTAAASIPSGQSQACLPGVVGRTPSCACKGFQLVLQRILPLAGGHQHRVLAIEEGLDRRVGNGSSRPCMQTM